MDSTSHNEISKPHDTTDSKSTGILLEKIVTNDLLYDLIFDACTARSLVRLLRTCREFHISVKDYMARRFNITTHLSRFFKDPTSFRYLQATTGTVISGSNALQFFDRTLYSKSDLDLDVPFTWRANVGHYLLAEGYSFVPGSIRSSSFINAGFQKRAVTNNGLYGNLKGIAAVFTFEKRSSDGKELQVQIFVAVRSPMEVILRFHSCTSNGSFGTNQDPLMIVIYSLRDEYHHFQPGLLSLSSGHTQGTVVLFLHRSQ